MDVSRRNFLRGSIAAGALAFGGSALAACAPATKGEAKKDAATSGTQSGRWSWSNAPEPIADSSIKETKECDICVVGAGVAGNPAALYAAMSGASVVVLQKGSKTQINGQECGVWNNDAALEEQFGVQTDVNTDLQKYADFADGKANLALVRNIMSRTGEALKWVTDTVPEPASSVSKVDDHLRYRWILNNDVSTRYQGFMDFHENIAKKAQENGAEYLFDTPAVQLVSENGAITGVIGQTKSGDYIKVNASKGVILCAGDVSDDDEMLEAFCPAMIGIPSKHAASCNTGDGLKMGMWIGASYDNPPAGMQMHLSPSPLPGNAPFSGVPWLHVNKLGKRFTNENVNFQNIATAISLQPDHIAWQIIDSHIMEHAKDYTNGGRPGSQEELDAAVENGCILKCDTLEELAEKTDLPFDTLKETIDRYNELVENGIDEDYGMSPEFFKWNGINDAPFYAIQREPARLVAAPGLRCNEYCQVENTNHEPIEGLYAAGNTQGAFFGYDYPVTGFSGFSNSRSVTGGIMAVKAILGTFDEPIA